ncbi:MAG: hypothetical protein R3F48_01570 [Candidatus Zixiibacteriota bacterium]
MPEQFLPHILLDGVHSAPTFSPDGSEMYWSRYYIPEGGKARVQHIFFSRYSDGRWSAPELAAFSGVYSDGGPFITDNGKRLIYYSNRPIEPGAEPGDEYLSDIWYIEMTDSGFGEPKRFPYNTEAHDGMASAAADGSIVFQSNRPGSYGIFDIYYSELIDGAYAKPKNLGTGVNCAGINFSPLIAPDKSFLIIAYNNNGADNGLHISFRKQDGGWTKPISMGERINSTSVQRFPGLSPDGRYLFFTRAGSERGVYWVETGIIDSLKREVLEQK